MLRRDGASKNPSKRTQLLIPKIFAKGTIPSTTKKHGPKFKKDPFKEVTKLPRLPTKVRKQTISAKKIEISQTERDKTIRISSELLERHLKLRDISELRAFKTCDIEDPNKRIGGLSDSSVKVTEAHILTSKKLGKPFTGHSKPDSKRLDIKRLECQKVVSTEGPSTEESISSFAPPKYTKATSTAKKNQQFTKLVGTYLKEDKTSKQELIKEDKISCGDLQKKSPLTDQSGESPQKKVISETKRVLNSIKHIQRKRKLAEHPKGQSRKELPLLEINLTDRLKKSTSRGRPRNPRKYQRTQSKDAPHIPKLNVLTSSRGHAQLEKKSLFGARNQLLEFGSRLSIRRRSGLEDTTKNNASQPKSPKVCDTGQRGDKRNRFLGPIYPVYSIFDREQTPNSQRIKSRTLGVTSYFGNTLVSLNR